MKKKEIKKIKERKVKSEDEYDVIKFIKILSLIIIFIIIFYLFTRLVIKKDLFKQEKKTAVNSGEINSDKLIVGNMLNSKSYSTYYVFLYKGSDSKAILYSTYLYLYSKQEKALKCYWVDLDNSLNSKYLTSNGATNPKAAKITELKLGKHTLIKVKNGQIVKYLEDIEQIKAELEI